MQLWSRCIERIGTTKAGSIVGSARETANCFLHGVVLATRTDRDKRHFVAMA